MSCEKLINQIEEVLTHVPENDLQRNTFLAKNLLNNQANCLSPEDKDSMYSKLVCALSKEGDIKGAMNAIAEIDYLNLSMSLVDKVRESHGIGGGAMVDEGCLEIAKRFNKKNDIVKAMGFVGKIEDINLAVLTIKAMVTTQLTNDDISYAKLSVIGNEGAKMATSLADKGHFFMAMKVAMALEGTGMVRKNDFRNIALAGITSVLEQKGDLVRLKIVRKVYRGFTS